ncbi:Trypanosomal VSG domain containing protein [Trypanosoma brucei equiperdum]|uniref:Trypanosomal VSG domain containing protein n=1 Tax=Trypanosoma brucei equiperdum TaxID=630700 RepID=A0A3L6LA71_9TRYP|nr:Trypanosomal VSG domain containing protein [Trypanosoma brucei equiperdum]RHW73510.1 Trypanosomal VSG domain containing protein [Trypanosoma brucei equiperdum]RHW73658.1 Trypanosomal VSG domain containing protein [Trypanosoma brucei equiperdum]RHW73672.1 Trypanosomal VSG domain containing protein [Trypanosoma brucei equiperdum]
MLIKFSALTILLYHCLSRTEAATGSPHTDFLALCNVYNAAIVLEKSTEQAPYVGSYLTYIQNNMSAASNEWKALFDKGPEELGWQKFEKHPNLKRKINWATDWPTWQAARTATKNPSEWWAKEHPEANDKAKVAALQAVVSATAEEAVLLHKQATTESTDGQQTLSAATKETIGGALCGPPITRKNKTLECTETISVCDKPTTCAKAETGKGVMHDLLCLCHTSGGNECTGSAVPELTANSNAFVAKAVKKLKELCGKPVSTGDHAVEMQLALSKFTARLGAGKQVTSSIKMALGTTMTGTNCGSSNSACVDYPSHFSAENKGYASIELVQAIQKALNLSIKRKQHEQTRDQAARALKDLCNTVSSEFKRPAQTNTEIAQTKRGETDTKNEQQTSFPKKNTTTEECPEAHCDYDTRHRNANPNQEQKIQQQEQQETPNLEEKKCSDFTAQL